MTGLIAPPLRRYWPDLAIVLTTIAALGLLPVALGGYVHERTFAHYALFLREIVGEAGVMPLETPKPLTTLRAALGEQLFYWSGVMLFSLTPVFLGRLSRRLYGTRIVGVGAVVLLLLANKYFLPEAVLSGYWPLSYLGLMALVLYSFAVGRYGASVGAVAVAGLIRPDAWGYALFLLATIYVTDRDRWRAVYLTSLLAMPAWLLFDVLLAGDPLYSLSTTRRYQGLMGLETVSPATYLPELFSSVSGAYSAPLVVAGVLGLGLALLRARGDEQRFRALGVLAGLVFLPLLGYWGLSAYGDGYLLHVRFFVLPLCLLLFSALLLPLEGLRLWTHWNGSRANQATWEKGVASLVLLLILAGGWLHKDGWTRTTELHRVRLMHREVRAEAIERLRLEWTTSRLSLLTGRSLEVFALRLGPDAASRMMRFRFVGAQPARLHRSPSGVAVVIGGDTGGYGARFRPLLQGNVFRVTVAGLSLRFEPRVGLKYRGQNAGIIYQYRPEREG